MKTATATYRDRLAVRGGYVYFYSVDLTRRLGEGPADPEEIWVQPPGTPTVGLAFVKGFEATGDTMYRDGALAAADALIYGQLESGCWTNSIDFNPKGPRVARYRNGNGGGSRSRNFSTLDDDISQSALRFLMQLDRALGFQHEGVHACVERGLTAMLAAQFPCGAFPQGWDEEPNPRPEPTKARYPDYDWRTEGRIKNYWDMYTLNDGAAVSISDTLLMAIDVYGDKAFESALVRFGDFLIDAQLPEPQPAWAQQYNYDMQPIWARRFEPAAVAGRESEDVLETLIAIHRHTGNNTYLKPIPRAIEYLKRSLLVDGRLARYYELRTNKPLYMTRSGRDYSLTHDDSNLPDHYGWKNESRLDAIKASFASLGREPTAENPADIAATPARIQSILDALDEQGRWVSIFNGERLVGQPKFRPGDKYINSAVFSENLTRLSEFVRANVPMNAD